MEAFISTVHIFVAVVLILLVLVQDSKGGGLGIGGGTSTSVLGAAGAENILAKVTRIIALLFAITCIILTIMSSEQSALDKVNATAAPVAAPTSETAPTDTATPQTAPTTKEEKPKAQ